MTTDDREFGDQIKANVDAENAKIIARQRLIASIRFPDPRT